MYNFIISTLLIFSYSTVSFANTSLNTRCTKNAANGQIEGLNINTPYTIASVTKVFTSHWAISRLGPQFRFPTIIHAAPVEKNIYDVHIEGSLFPYFDKTFYQFFIGELNNLGIRHINNLTFDENFLYSTNVRTDSLLAHGNKDLNINEIIKELTEDSKTINNGLAALNAKALAIENLKLPNVLSLTINDIHFLGKNDFEPTSDTVSFYLQSTELYRNLKEMNRNSNNFVADKIFKMLSEKENYRDFILNYITEIKPDEVTLFNGSGYPAFIDSNKVYNEASCAAVVEMMADLKQSLKNTGFDIKDIMPVAGKDSVEDGNSTVTKIYGSELTSGVLIGKTGSVIDTVALAGIIATENENVFFQTSFNVDNTIEDRQWAYSKIKDWLNELIKDKKKSDLNSYQPKTFLPFDGKSQLKRINSIKLLY